MAKYCTKTILKINKAIVTAELIIAGFVNTEKQRESTQDEIISKFLNLHENFEDKGDNCDAKLIIVGFYSIASFVDMTSKNIYIYICQRNENRIESEND